MVLSRPYAKGFDALVALIAARADLDAVFVDAKVPQYLARISGGSLRDLIRLLFEAQSFARVDGKSRIDQSSAKDAVQRVRRSLERTLWPCEALARHSSVEEPARARGRRPAAAGAGARLLRRPPDQGRPARIRWPRAWYDVHPIMRAIRHSVRPVDPAEPGRLGW